MGSNPKPSETMQFRLVFLIAATLLPASALCVEGTKLAPVSLSLRVNADGTLSDLACGPKVDPELCPVLTKAVSRWKFAPGQRDSSPANTDVWLILDLVAVQKPQGFSLQATRARIAARNPNASAGDIDPATRAMNPPTYPRNEQRRGIGAMVAMELLPQPGSTHPVPGQVWVNGQPADKHDAFAQASREAVAKWDMAELPPDQLSSCVTIQFTVDKPGQPLPPGDTDPCVSKFKAGFLLPKLLTDPLTASF